MPKTEVKIILAEEVEQQRKGYKTLLTNDREGLIRSVQIARVQELTLKDILSTAKTIDVDGLAGEVFNWFVENDIKVQMLRSPEAKILQAGEHVEPAKRLAAAIIDYIAGGK